MEEKEVSTLTRAEGTCPGIGSSICKGPEAPTMSMWPEGCEPWGDGWDMRWESWKRRRGSCNLHLNGPSGCRTKIDWGRGGRRETNLKAAAVAQGERDVWQAEPDWQLGGGEVCGGVSGGGDGQMLEHLVLSF